MLSSRDHFYLLLPGAKGLLPTWTSLSISLVFQVSVHGEGEATPRCSWPGHVCWNTALISEFTSGEKKKKHKTCLPYLLTGHIHGFYVGVKWESTSEYLITILSRAEVALSVLLQNWTE